LKLKEKTTSLDKRESIALKSNVTLKESVNVVFDKLGGVQAMAEWASKYPTEFYKMYAKVLDSALKNSAAVPEKGEIIIEGKAKDL